LRDWLESQFAHPDQHFDRTVSDLLTATGKTTENGAVNFVLAHLGERVPEDKVVEEGQFSMVPITSRTMRLFLGIQVQCAQCHDHPFNQQLKQEHFWGINAFFRQVERKGVPAMGRDAPAAMLELVDHATWNNDRIIFFERRNGVVKPTRPVFLDGQKMIPRPETTRRQQLAEFILHDEHFAKAFVNRMWGHFFGRGLTSPGAVDDFGDHNPVVHPRLLDLLAKDFQAGGYNPRDVIRWICTSDAYGLTSVANRTNDKADVEPYFSRMLLKAMTPEQLFESLMTVTQAEATDTREEKQKLRNAWTKNLIVNFGDDEGTEVTFNGTVVQALILMNGKELNDAIAHKDRGPLATAIKRKRLSGKTIFDDLYLVVLNRPPTASEYREVPRRLMMRVPDKDAAAPLQDLVWALINSNEFILNH
jgi:hypothetical protein